MKLPKFNQKGIAHILAPLLFIAIFAGIGGIVLLKSHAASVVGNGGTYVNGRIFFGGGTINSDGTGTSYLYGLPDKHNANISFDGTKVAFDNYTVDPTTGAASNYSLHVGTISNQSITNKITLSQYPSGYYVEDPPKWSPDGTKVAVETPTKPSTVSGGTRIWVGHTDGSAGHFVPNLPSNIDGFGWLPGSVNLVYSQHTSSGNAFCTISTGGVSYGCHPVALGTGDYLGLDLAVSPVDGKVALLAGHNYSHNGSSYSGFSQYIYTVNSNGSGLKRILALGPTMDIMAAVWSPDGTKLAFYQEDESTNTLSWKISVVNADGNGMTVISSRGSPNSLSWAHK